MPPLIYRFERYIILLQNLLAILDEDTLLYPANPLTSEVVHRSVLVLSSGLDTLDSSCYVKREIGKIHLTCSITICIFACYLSVRELN